MSELQKYIKTDRNFQKIKLLSGKSIGITPWLLKEEKDFLFAVETQAEEPEIVREESIKLIRKCVDKPEFFDNLSKNDIISILVELRKISKGSDVEFHFKCENEKCPTFLKYTPEKQKETGLLGESTESFPGVIDCEKDVKVVHFDNKPVIIRDIKIHFKELSYQLQKNLEEKFFKKEGIQPNAFQYDFFKNCICKIEIGTEEIENFSQEELEEFLNTNLSGKEYEKIIEEFTNRLSSIKIEKELECPVCKHKTEVVYGDLFSLFVF